MSVVLRKLVGRARLILILGTFFSLAVMLFTSEIIASVFNVKFLSENIDFWGRVALGFKPTVVGLFVVCTGIIIWLALRALKPLFTYVETGEGFKKARTATLKIPPIVLGIQVVFWFIGTTAYFILKGWQADSGLPYGWVLAMKVSGGIISGIFCSFLINVSLKEIKAGLGITKIDEKENDFFSRNKSFIMFFSIAVFISITLGYVMYFYSELAGGKLDIQFLTGFLILALYIALVSFSVIIVYRREESFVLKQLINNLLQGAHGQAELSTRLVIQNFDEFGDLTYAFNQFLARLGSDFKGVEKQVQLVYAASQKMAEAARNINERVASQSTGCNQIHASISAFAKSMEVIAGKTEKQAQIMQLHSEQSVKEFESFEKIVNSSVKLNDYTKGSVQDAGKGLDVVRRSVESNIKTNEYLKELGQEIVKTGEVSSHVSTLLRQIEDIAERTNLLAVNASIEAAHAGTFGKGFAIVAGEIRTLSALTTEAVDNISRIVADIQSQVNRGVEIAEQSSIETSMNSKLSHEALEVMEGIVRSMENSAHDIQSISSTAQNEEKVLEQSSKEVLELKEAALETRDAVLRHVEDTVEVGKAVEEFSEDNRSNSESSIELLHLAEELAASGKELQNIVQGFHIE